jgi:hypothetical protein
MVSRNRLYRRLSRHHGRKHRRGIDGGSDDKGPSAALSDPSKPDLRALSTKRRCFAQQWRKQNENHNHDRGHHDHAYRATSCRRATAERFRDKAPELQDRGLDGRDAWKDAMEFMRTNCPTNAAGRAIGKKQGLCQAMLDEWQARADANAAACMEKVIHPQ